MLFTSRVLFSFWWQCALTQQGSSVYLDSFCVAQKVRSRATDSDEVEPQLGSGFGPSGEVKEECRALATEEESLKEGRS